MSTVSRDVPVNRLFSWSRNFDVDRDENVLKVIAHVNDCDYHIQPDAATITRLKGLRDQILKFMAQEVLIEGTILEIWERQLVEHPAYETEEYVQIYPEA